MGRRWEVCFPQAPLDLPAAQGDVLLQYAEGGGMTIVTRQGLEAAISGGTTALLEVPDVAQAKALRAALPGALLLYVSSPDELDASLAQVSPRCWPQHFSAEVVITTTTVLWW